MVGALPFFFAPCSAILLLSAFGIFQRALFAVLCLGSVWMSSCCISRENRPWTVAALDPKCRMRSQVMLRFDRHQSYYSVLRQCQDILRQICPELLAFQASNWGSRVYRLPELGYPTALLLRRLDAKRWEG